MDKKIAFSPPDINEDDIQSVVEVLRSGWITTGKKCKEFESMLASFTNTKNCSLLSSATSAMELALRLYDISQGDEVITTPYTYAATSNVILHTGAKAIFVDTIKDSFSIDPNRIEYAITEKTKAIIPVDFGGYPVDYDDIKNIAIKKSNIFNVNSNSSIQNELGRILLVLDAAHSLGAKYGGVVIGGQLDFTAFSFHAVKNLTTAEGGALVYNDIGSIDSSIIYKELSKWMLHGQNKSAFEKTTGNYKYSIDIIGYKFNMSDIHAALGVTQLLRYEKMLEKRKAIFDLYNSLFSNYDDFITPQFNESNKETSYHLYPLRIKNYEEDDRDLLIEKMGESGIALNVHFIPIPMHKAYKDLGYDIKDYPNAYNMYKNEVSLPIYSKLDIEDALYVAESLIDYCHKK